MAFMDQSDRAKATFLTYFSDEAIRYITEEYNKGTSTSTIHHNVTTLGFTKKNGRPVESAEVSKIAMASGCEPRRARQIVEKAAREEARLAAKAARVAERKARLSILAKERYAKKIAAEAGAAGVERVKRAYNKKATSDFGGAEGSAQQKLRKAREMLEVLRGNSPETRLAAIELVLA